MTDEALDRVLRHAFLDAVREDAAATQARVSYSPSARHQREMRRMLNDPIKWSDSRQRTWRKRHGVLNKIAVVLLTMLIGVGIWLSVSPEARAMVSRWISYQKFGSQYYEFLDDREPPEKVPRYHIGWIPDGFFLQEDDYGGNHGNVTYANEAETKFISLGYSLMGSTSFGYSDGRSVAEENLTINGMDAKFFEWAGEDWHYLVWLDEEHGLVFTLGADLVREDCIRVAESIYAEDAKH